MTQPSLVAPVLAFARISFTELLSYRIRYAVGILNYVIYMAVQYFIWTAVYASAPGGGESIAGYELGDLVTYFAIGWIVRVSYYNNIDRELADRVSQGDVALDLLRPVSLMARYYGQAIGEASLRLFLMGIPTSLILFPLFSVNGPTFGEGATAIAGGAAFALSVLLALHIFFLVNFAIGASTVFFEKIRGFLWAKFMLVQFLSGQLVPYEYFPGWARAVLEALPFRSMIYAPVSIYVGKARGSRLVLELGLQILWVVALWAVARWLWSRCRARLLVQGG